MIILAIETSCDDTCLSVLKAGGNDKFKILANIVSSQVKIHRPYGGVYPFLAKREHQKNLPILFKKIKKRLGIFNGRKKVDLIAVTSGPGLEPCLWVGINFAKSIAEEWKIPILPINHIEGHILANWLPPVGEEIRSKNIFPAVSLIVSGGHTQLILIKDFRRYKILGETRDDAAGECFDKTARILGLGYPGGPAIAKTASQIKTRDPKISLPRPMIYQKNYDFSFSGLKTAVLYHFKSQNLKKRKSKEYIAAMAFEIQQAICDVLVKKTMRAVGKFEARAIILGGGVVSNNELRKRFKKEAEKLKINLFVPPQKFCTDNAAMIAATAYFHWIKDKKGFQNEITANSNLRI